MTTDNTEKQIRNTPLRLIVASPYQVRAEDDEDIASLADDMQANGLIQPVTVRHMKSDYCVRWELVAGHRRVAAARKLGWETIPAVVVDADDDQAEAMLVAENFARRDLTPLEMADTAAGLVKRHGAAEAGRICGKSERWAQRMAYIAGRLTPDWRRVAQRWTLSQASLQAICKGSAEVQAQKLADALECLDCTSVDDLFAKYPASPPADLARGGDPESLDCSYDSTTLSVAKLPWQICGCGDCDNCTNRTDATPELMFDEGDERRRDPGCLLRKCYVDKLKEWLGGRGIQEWSRKIGMQVVPLPTGVQFWVGFETRDESHTIPVFLGEKAWPAGALRWFPEEVLEPKKARRKKAEEVWPTAKEVRDRAFTETARKWFKEGKTDITLANLMRIAVAILTGEDIAGKREYALDRRLALARELSAQDAETVFRHGLIDRFVGANESTRKQWEALIAVAIRDEAARSAMDEEAAALADRRIADIEERKKQLRAMKKKEARR